MYRQFAAYCIKETGDNLPVDLKVLPNEQILDYITTCSQGRILPNLPKSLKLNSGERVACQLMEWISENSRLSLMRFGRLNATKNKTKGLLPLQCQISMVPVLSSWQDPEWNCKKLAYPKCQPASVYWHFELDEQIQRQYIADKRLQAIVKNHSFKIKNINSVIWDVSDEVLVANREPELSNSRTPEWVQFCKKCGMEMDRMVLDVYSLKDPPVLPCYQEYISLD